MVKNENGAWHSWKRVCLIAGVIGIMAVGGWLLKQNLSPEKTGRQQSAVIHQSIPQASGDKLQPQSSLGDSPANREIIASYISDFLEKGYEKYYAIQQISHRFVSLKQGRGQLEAVVMTNMKSRPQNPATDPDTVPYIQDARVKAEKETDPQLKKVSQKIYETLKQEYGQVVESNYTFKLTAHLDGDMIDEESIRLYYVQDAAPNHTEYLPAEELLPK